MKKLPAVTIGIPAYNEEANIKNTLQSILQQRFAGFEVVEIMVVSDGSTDKTKEKVKELKDERIKFIDSKERLGKPSRQNQIFKAAKGSIIVLFDADVILASYRTLHYLVQPILKNKNVGLVSGYNIVTPGVNLFQKALNVAVQFKERTFSRLRNGDNIYLCAGRLRAFSPEFKKIIVWPDVFNEDPYSYLLCKFNGFGFVYEKRAEVYFQNPSNLRDHRRQSDRFKGMMYEMAKFFPEDFIRLHLSWPKRLFVESAIYHMVRHPFLFIYYLIIFSFTNIVKANYKKLTTRWEVSITSKVITRKV